MGAWPRHFHADHSMSKLTPQRTLAIDLGAGSGRAVVGTFDGERLAVDEVHRFANRPIQLPGALHWDILALFGGAIEAISAARVAAPLDSIGIDGWGVDFGLLDRDGELLGNPVHYRDPRTDGVIEAVDLVVPRSELFRRTGIQALQINTLYQLAALRRHGRATLDSAHQLLLIPDLMTYWLTGVRSAEWTNATTTGCIDVTTRAWAIDLLGLLKVPQRIFPEIVQPGTVAGPLRIPGTFDIGSSTVRVVVSASHDTAAAVAAIPLGGLEDAYISSGTWSLVGVETSAPLITPEAEVLRVTNEAGIGGTYRLLRNVMGLWLLQGLQESLAQRGIATSHEGLVQAANQAGPARSWIDPDDRALLHPHDMVEAVRNACRVSGQPMPSEAGELVRVVLESLALRYRWIIEGLERLTGRAIQTVHIVGGGARNDLLCQLTADATGRQVIVGPVEATAIGNVLVQLTATGSLGSIVEGRELVARSIPRRRIEPVRDGRWQEAYARFVKLIGAGGTRPDHQEHARPNP